MKIGDPMKLIRTILFLITTFVSLGAWGQSSLRYPTKSIDVVVTYAPGGAGDTWMRLVMPYVSQKFGVPINIVNRVGGSGVVGTMSVITAQPDGYTILFDGLVTPSVTAIQASAPFQWTDLTPIAKIASAPLAFAVPVDSSWKTLKQALDDIKKDPGQAKAGVGGSGSPATFALSKLFESVGINAAKINRVIFDGSTPTMAALAGGHVAYTSQPLQDSLPLVAAGKIRILAISASKRNPDAPQIPTGLELGYPSYDLGTWGALEGPPKLPAQIVQVWSDVLREVLQNPELVEKLKTRQTVVDFLSPEDTRKFLENEYTMRRGIAERLGLRK